MNYINYIKFSAIERWKILDTFFSKRHRLDDLAEEWFFLSFIKGEWKAIEEHLINSWEGTNVWKL